MSIPSRRLLLAAPLLGLAGRAAAQGVGAPGNAAPGDAAAVFPTRTVRTIVPYTPGGAADIAARLLAERLPARWGQSMVVENRPGADGVVGTEAVARSAPDGYTLGMVSVNHAVNVPLHRTPFDTLRDLVALTVVYTVPLVLVAAPDFPANTPEELAAYARSHPGAVTFAATGGAVTMAGELFALRAGAEMVRVPYRGSTAAHPDLMSGRVSIIFDTLPAVRGHVQTGKLKALATTAAQRVPALPDVPTVAERGFPGFEASSWGALIAPAGLPPAVAARIAGDAVAVVQSAEMREKLAGFGAEPVASGTTAAQEFVRAEVAKWSDVAARAGIERQ